MKSVVMVKSFEIELRKILHVTKERTRNGGENREEVQKVDIGTIIIDFNNFII